MRQEIKCMSEISIFVSIWFKSASSKMLTEFILFHWKKVFSKMKCEAIKSMLNYLSFVFFRNVSVFLRLLKYVHVIHLLSCFILSKLLLISLDHITVHWLTTSQSKYLKPFRDSLYERFLKPLYLFTTYTREFHIFVHPKYLQK